MMRKSEWSWGSVSTKWIHKTLHKTTKCCKSVIVVNVREDSNLFVEARCYLIQCYSGPLSRTASHQGGESRIHIFFLYRSECWEGLNPRDNECSYFSVLQDHSRSGVTRTGHRSEIGLSSPLLGHTELVSWKGCKYSKAQVLNTSVFQRVWRGLLPEEEFTFYSSSQITQSAFFKASDVFQHIQARILLAQSFWWEFF